jgi:hypothetical protein
MSSAAAAAAQRADSLYQQLLQEYLCAFVPHLSIEADG